MKKRWISLLLAMVMLLSALPVQAVEAEPAVTEAEAAEIEVTESAEVLTEERTAEEEPVCIHADTVTDAAVAATCTESGLTEGSRCAACGEILTAQEVIPAAGHSWADADCTNPKTCTVCGLTEGEALGHSWVDADCETPKTCAVCGVTAGEVLEHIYVEGTCATCDTAAAWPAAPVVKASTAAATGKAKLTWEAVDGAVTYTVYRSDAKDGTYTLLDATADTGFEDAAAVAGEKYYYYIVAEASDGTVSAPSNIVGRTCDLAQPVVSVSNVAASGKVRLTWEAVDGAVKYRVYRSAEKDGTYKNVFTTENTSYINTSAKAGEKYYYKVRAISENTDAHSAYSTVRGRTCDLAQPVVAVSNVTDTGKVQLTWEAVDGAVKYRVYRAAEKDGEYKNVYTTTGTKYTNTAAKAGEKYYYKVRAISDNTDAHSVYSTVRGRTCNLPQPVAIIDTASTTLISLSWDAVDGAVSYQVYRSEGGKYTLLANVTETKLSDSDITAGMTYFYKVRAVAENSDANSAYSEIVTGSAVPAAPEMKTTAQATKSTIKISWNESAGASGYYIYRRASTSDDWTRIADVTSGTSYTDNVSGRYYYSVAAYVTAGGTNSAGARSDAIRCRTLTAAVVTAISHVYNNDVSWETVTGATGYQIYRKSDSNTSWVRLSTLGKVTSYADENVNCEDHYYYRVRPIYKHNGVTTYGPYTSAEARYVGSASDDYATRCYAIFGEYVDDPRLYYSSSSEAAADMTTVTIKAWEYTDSSRTTKTTETYTLKVHKNLAYTVQLMFAELYACEEQYPVSDIGGFTYKYKSEHSSGLAFDINVSANPYVDPDGTVLVGTKFDPENNPYSIPVGGEVEELFYKYGFIRGIYWGNGYKDYMHFSFFGT